MNTKTINHIDLGETMPLLANRRYTLGNDLIVIECVTTEGLISSAVQLNFLVFCYCDQGMMRFLLGDKECTFRAGDFFISTGGQAIRKLDFDDSFRGRAVLMSRAYAQESITGLNYLWPHLLYVISHPVIHLDEKEQLWVLDCYNLLCKRLSNSVNHLFLRETVLALTRAFYYDVCDLLASRAPKLESSRYARSYTIFDRFARLTAEHYRKERSVEWYAKQLCITPKHLSEVVKSVSGRTAGQWISSMVLIEVKSLLQNTDLSIKEIAQELNFPNQSFLGKFFKNMEGVPPSEFRAKDTQRT